MNMEAEKEKLGVSFDISPNGFHINIIFSNPANCLFSNFSEVSHLEFGLSFSEGNNLEKQEMAEERNHHINLNVETFSGRTLLYP